MIERCRDWKHTPSCEYLSTIPVSLDKGKQSICLCGRGNVGRDFPVVSAGTWNIFEPHVTRIAVAPLFAAAYIEPTRTLWNLMAEGKWEEMRILRYPEPIDDSTDIEALKTRCRVCWKEKGNKCARCNEVSYCSKECQKKDWREHKEALQEYCDLIILRRLSLINYSYALYHINFKLLSMSSPKLP